MRIAKIGKYRLIYQRKNIKISPSKFEGVAREARRGSFSRGGTVQSVSKKD